MQEPTTTPTPVFNQPIVPGKSIIQRLADLETMLASVNERLTALQAAQQPTTDPGIRKELDDLRCIVHLTAETLGVPHR